MKLAWLIKVFSSYPVYQISFGSTKEDSESCIFKKSSQTEKLIRQILSSFIYTSKG